MSTTDPADDATPFSYSNLSGRDPGRLLAAISRVVPGIGAVQDMVPEYAARWQQANRRALASSGPLWVVLGDSMSQGIGASTWEQGWVNQTARRLAADGGSYRLVNLSVSGARVGDVIERQVPAMRELEVAPDLVTVLIGANNLGRRAYRDRLPTDFSHLIDLLPDGAVIATMPQPIRPAREVNALIERAVDARGMVAASTAVGPHGWRGRLASDHFHPNDLGYASIADTFVTAITR